MVNTCVMHGMHGLVMAQRRLSCKYTYPSDPSDDYTCTINWVKTGLSHKRGLWVFNKDAEQIQLHTDQLQMDV